MGMLAWTMMGLAIWHFTVFLPDRFWGGIVGALLGALAGALLFGLAVSGFSVPGQHDTDIVTTLYAVPGTVIGLAVVYLVGSRREAAETPGRGQGRGGGGRRRPATR
jgi:ABC-type Fe3+ transport system permease subunit